MRAACSWSVRGIPLQHSQGAQGIPAAWPALAVVDLQRHPAAIPGLERPSTLIVALRCDDLDRLGDAFVRLHAGAPQVLEPPQQVVMPPRWKGEARPVSAALAIPLDHLAGRSSAQQAALEEVFLPAQARRGHRAIGAARLLILEQRLE